MAGAKKGSKNNPDNKIKQKQFKTHESSFCEKNCKDKDTCKEYRDYIDRLKKSGKGFGVICKQGK